MPGMEGFTCSTGVCLCSLPAAKAATSQGIVFANTKCVSESMAEAGPFFLVSWWGSCSTGSSCLVCAGVQSVPGPSGVPLLHWPKGLYPPISLPPLAVELKPHLF